MTDRRPLTTLAQEAVAKVLQPGGRAIDATMGNGHDTLFLSRRLAPKGRVFAFDIQPPALTTTAARLRNAGLDRFTELRLCGHEKMIARLPADWPGTVSAIMFNLGYLPGGDKAVITRASTTLAALDQALQLLRPGGLLSLLLYRGHPGAQGETQAVLDWLDRLPDSFQLTRVETPGPWLLLISAVDPAAR